MRTWLAALAAMMLLAGGALAQQRPTNNPTYIPTGRLAETTLTAAGDVAYKVNGEGTIMVRATGTNTGVAAVVDCTNGDSAPTYTVLPAFPVGGGGGLLAISADGAWRVNGAGCDTVRFHLTAISTGSIKVTMTGSPQQLHMPWTYDTGALITNAAQGAGTVNSADFSAIGYKSISCVFNETAHGGSPSTTFAIQGKDAASASYVTLITSAAITTDTNSLISAGAGVPTTSNVSLGTSLPATLRVTETVGGTGTPTTTGTIGCTLN